MTKVIRFDQSHDWYFKTGMKHARRQNTSAAIRYMVRASELDPGNREYYMHIARLFNKSGEYAQSNKILLFLTALLNDDLPRNKDMLAEAYYWLSQNCTETDEYEKSVCFAEKCIKCQPNGRFVEECEAVSEYFKSCGYICWDDKWDAIIDLCMKNSAGIYNEIYRDELEILMINIGYNAIDGRYPEECDFERTAVWAAVLEYIYSKISRVRKTRKAIAAKYGITLYALNKHLFKVFDIDIL